MGQRAGAALNALVGMLERAFASSPDVTVGVGEKLRDADTKRLREHDVLITRNHGHHRIVTAIECRDRSRPIGVPDVEAFSDKCAHTGVHHPVMVSSCGFRGSAIEKAKARGVTLLELQQVDSFDWSSVEFMTQYTRSFLRMQVGLVFADAMPEGDVVLFDTECNEVSNDMLVATISNRVPYPDNPEEYVGKETTIRIQAITQDWFAEDRAGAKFPIGHLDATGVFTVRRRIVPMLHHTYGSDQKSYEIATADLTSGQIEGSLMIIKEDEGIRISFQGREVGGVS